MSKGKFLQYTALEDGYCSHKEYKDTIKMVKSTLSLQPPLSSNIAVKPLREILLRLLEDIYQLFSSGFRNTSNFALLRLDSSSWSISVMNFWKDWINESLVSSYLFIRHYSSHLLAHILVNSHCKEADLSIKGVKLKTHFTMDLSKINSSQEKRPIIYVIFKTTFSY